MALTSNDETDLLLPLYRGMHEEPRFATFLDRLKRRTNATYTAIAMGPRGGFADDTSLHFAGPPWHQTVLQPSTGLQTPDMASALNKLRDGRVYSAAELIEIAAHSGLHAAPLPRADGIVDLRVVRIPVDPQFGGWLIMARTRMCTAADSALLSKLAPYVETALRCVQDAEREHGDAVLSGDALSRAGAGWIVFDGDARIIAAEARTRNRIAEITGSETRPGERLRGIAAQAERKLVETASRMAGGDRLAASSAVLYARPRIEALLIPAAPGDEARRLFPDAAMIAYCRFETDSGEDSAARLSGLYDLPAREAQLAIALADGRSIAEAAQAMGLTLETARNYSKRLYAKLGVSGQVQLVRLVHRSAAVLA